MAKEQDRQKADYSKRSVDQLSHEQASKPVKRFGAAEYYLPEMPDRKRPQPTQPTNPPQSE